MKHKVLTLKQKDGTTVHIPYKPTSLEKQRTALSQWLVSEGHRPSEAAMNAATMSINKVRRLYQNLVVLGKVKQ